MAVLRVLNKLRYFCRVKYLVRIKGQKNLFVEPILAALGLDCGESDY
jgi:hypothetical protein